MLRRLHDDRLVLDHKKGSCSAARLHDDRPVLEQKEGSCNAAKIV